MTDNRHHAHLPLLFSRSARLTAVAVSALLLAGAIVAPAAAASSASGSEAAAASKHKSEKAFTDGRYIVTLRDSPVATYDGGVKSFAATRAPAGKNLAVTSKKVAKYSSYLEQEQDDVADSVDAKIVTSYTLATNGFSGELSAGQATTLSRDARVQSVVKDELLHVQSAVASTDFLGLSGDTGVWDSLGGIDEAGDGVVVGIIDTGIAPENDSFAGDALGTTPGDAPYRDGDATVYDKSDGTQFRGECVTGVQFTADDCTTKIIGARYFVDNFGAETLASVEQGEYLSPRDGAGHGSHTASTSAGNADVQATVNGSKIGRISGVAPAAKIAVYKVCWESFDEENGCQTGDLVAAIDAAVADNVDVLNFSIGGGTAQTTVSLTDQAFLGAAAAGIFVSASAGNDGPDASTADNAAPWITTVAASSIPSYDATVVAGDGQKFVGGSITLPETGTVSGALISASAAAVTGAGSPTLCGPNTLDATKVTGKVVLCERGLVDRVAKSAEVARAGGVGMVLVNVGPESVDLDIHSVPTIHLDYDSFDAITKYAQTAGASVVFAEGNTSSKPSAATPQVAGFSSRGPILADGGDILKPDITAPGVAILADGANAEGEEGTYEFMSGTSMSAPHIAGLAALYLTSNPLATPAEIKSAMMTTAYNTVDADGHEVEDPFAQGAGHVDPTKFFEPGLVYLNDIDDWKAYIQAFGQINFGVEPIDGSELNLPSISIGSLAGVETVTRTVTSTKAGVFTVGDVSMPGVDVEVSPSTLEFTAAGETADYTVSFTRTDAPLDEFVTGYLRWTSGDTVVTSPLAVRPVTIAVAQDADGTGNSGSVAIPVLAGATTDIDVTTRGLAKGLVVHDSVSIGDPRSSYVVTVPEGTALTRINLDTDDETADLDLLVYSIDGYGGIYLTSQSATGSADERVDMQSPVGGTYIVEVSPYSGAGDIDYTLSSYSLASDESAGEFTASPESLDLHLGDSADVTASWAGLDSGSSYLGRVSFGDTGLSTIVTIETDALTAPAPSVGELAVTATPDWVRAGRGVALRGTGLIPGEKYDLYLDNDETSYSSGSATQDGSMSRYITLPQDFVLGEHSVELRVAGGSVSATITIAELVVTTLFELVDSAFDGTPLVRMDTIFAGKGKLHVTLESASGEVYLDEINTVEADPILDTSEGISTQVAVASGELHASVASVLPDGSEAQKHSVTFTVEKRDAGVATLTKNASDANSVDVMATNTSDVFVRALLRYKTCDGPVIFSELTLNTGLIEKTLDLAGITHLDMMLDGKTLASYDNAGSERCDGTPTIAQDLWVTLSYDPANAKSDTPITATTGFRYLPYSQGYDLSMGTGEVFEANRIFVVGIGVDRVTQQGPISTYTTQLAADTVYWVKARFEAQTPTIHYSALRRTFITAVTPEQLAAVTPDAKSFTVRSASGLKIVGSAMTVTATGLAKNEAYTVTMAGKTVATGTATATGTVSKKFTVPTAAKEGKRSIRVTGATAQRTGTVTVNVVAKKKTLSVKTKPGSKVKSGHKFTITVKSLAPGESVRITYRGKRVSATSAHASAAGTYSLRVKAGSSKGSKKITVTGVVSTRAGHTKIRVR